MKSITKHLIIWTLILIVTLNLALAIGIRPAKTTIVLADQQDQYDGEFWIVNNEQREFQVQVYAEGTLKDYIQIEKKQFKFSPDEEAQLVKFTLNLPKEVPPGLITNKIVVEEELKNPDQTVISSKLLLKHKLLVQGEYPDKYVEVKLNFNDRGENMELVSEVANKGKQSLDAVQTTFYVNGQEQPKEVLETETVPLAQNENTLLTAILEKDQLELGEFTVAAVTNYDELEVETIETMRLGTPLIDITYFTEFFLANKINDYSLDLMNRWNQRIENVYVDINVKENQQTVNQFRTKSVDLSGLGTARLSDYYDARNQGPGTLNFEMVVNFWNTYRMEKKVFTSEVLSEQEYALTGQAANQNFLGSATFKIIIVLAVLALMIVLILYLIRRRNKISKDDF